MTGQENKLVKGKDRYRTKPTDRDELMRQSCTRLQERKMEQGEKREEKDSSR